MLAIRRAAAIAEKNQLIAPVDRCLADFGEPDKVGFQRARCRNDSLVLVDFINRRRKEGMPVTEAVRIAGARRFRAIMLTSVTTFVGLMPLLFEKSTQAQFLIPMAISLGFGILFATLITLFLVPINYLVLEDIRRGFSWLWNLEIGAKREPKASEA